LQNALVNYLLKLHEAARLDVRAAYYQFDDEKPILHVLARTAGEPHKYFYRRWVDERYWTPWETVDLEITGDLELLFVHNGRLQLAWATLKELEQKPNLGPTIPAKGGDPYPDSSAPKTRWEIKLSLSQYADSRWLKKQVTPEGLIYPSIAVPDLGKTYKPD